MAQDTTEKVTGTQAIDRACDLLVRVMNAENPVTLTELVAATGLAKGTTSRILNALDRSGLLARSIHGGYEAGPILNHYAIRGGAYAALIETMTPAMEEIAAVSRETVSLAVAGREAIDSIAQVDGTYLLGSRNWVGETVPAHCSAGGKILLAFGALALPTQLQALTPATITDASVLDRQLRLVRERGYAVIRNELEPGLVSVAVPVFSANGKILAAMSVTGPAERITEAEEARIAGLMKREIDKFNKPQHEGAA